MHVVHDLAGGEAVAVAQEVAPAQLQRAHVQAPGEEVHRPLARRRSTASRRSRGRRRWAGGSCRSRARRRGRAGSGTGRRRRSRASWRRPGRSRRTRPCRPSSRAPWPRACRRGVAPRRTRIVAGWRLSVRNSSARSSTTLTGRPALRASAATTASVRTNVFAPNEPPIIGATIRTASGSRPNSPARSARRLNGVWVPVQSVSRPSSHSATAACGSIGTCAALGVRNASLTTTSARAHGGRGVAGDEPEAVADVRARRAGGRRSRPPPAPTRRRRRGAAARRERRPGPGRRPPAAPRSRPRSARGGARGRARGRGDGGHHVARVARDVREHPLVAGLAAVAAERGDVLGPERDGAGREARGVDAGHARVRVRRADERRVEHPRARRRRPSRPARR